MFGCHQIVMGIKTGHKCFTYVIEMFSFKGNGIYKSCAVLFSKQKEWNWLLIAQ